MIETIVEQVQFKGLLEEQKYYDGSSHWGIFYATVRDITIGNLTKGERYCIKGIIYTPIIGKVYDIKGEIDYTPTWGEQISIVECSMNNDLAENDIRGQKYILCKLFPSFVKEMYATLDNPYLALKEENYEELTKIKNCGTARATQWIVKFKDTYDKHKAYIDLARYSISDKMIEKILTYYHDDVDKAVDIIKNTPYELTQIKGIGWKTADEIALQNGADPYGVDRIKTCIQLFLREQGNNGKSFSYSEEVMEELMDKIGEDVPDLNIGEAMHDLKDSEVIVWNDDKTKISLKRFYDLEYEIANHLIRLRNASNKFQYANWESVIKKKEKVQGWCYTPQQMEGIKMVLNNQISCISGYGGTGKTSIIDGILTVLQDYESVTVALAGRAAARISEASSKESQTIHKLLKLSYGKRKTDYNYKYNPLPYDIIIVDEMSMIDGWLFNQILQACATGTKVIFIGDVGQLESIGCCAVAADMLESKHIPSIFLDKIHRQAQKSAIITESIRVRQGKQIIANGWSGEETRGELQDMILNCYTDKSNTYHNIVKYFKEEIKHTKSILDVQIIVPCKQGISSVASLNHIAQQIYNPKSKKQYKVEKSGVVQWILKVGDKVINKLNKYGIHNSDGTIVDIFNGNLGIIESIEKDCIVIDFQGIGRVEVPKSHAGNIELGYAITCHSAQGSQFDVVIGGIDFSMFIMLNKELLYTMITRASKKFILCAQNSALRYAITKEQIIHRQTYLMDALDDICSPKFNF